jgi:hypothetical protein
MSIYRSFFCELLWSDLEHRHKLFHWSQEVIRCKTREAKSVYLYECIRKLIELDIVTMDDDDISLPHRLTKQLKVMSKESIDFLTVVNSL